ncbi:MAG TPA: pyridoxamine 5'-phosphate oxidase family protein [Anaerolineales bacterium]|nr:pyridoxamine 5'-phosphate oxidase family protein [Anaerolineales bacterium]HLO33514.1 pyridoxamine 5'-phosphate oxidase family protein [Anaerolineales bacterium]
MQPPKVTRPKFPKGYVDKPVSFVDWNWVAARLTESENYWLCSVYPNGKPHVVPRWGVFLDGKVYYDGSPETRHGRNIKLNPYISVHLENGTQPIILYGTSVPSEKPSPELGTRLSEAYKKKYEEVGYAPEPHSWDGGGLYVFTPHECIAWTKFNEDPTKFTFEDGF